MRINRSYIIAAAAVILIAAWFAVNTLGKEAEVEATPEFAQAETTIPTVVVRSVTSEPHVISLEAYGRTAANREVEVKARTAASVIATPIQEGTLVKRGTVICRQDVDARQAVVDQAKAAVAKAEFDLNATKTLVERGFKSAAQITSDTANLDAARAQLRQAETELGNIVMRAPFTGVFDSQIAEVGDYLAPGQPCGLVVELDPLLVELELSETQVGQIALGDEVALDLATGQEAVGTVRFIEAKANPATRTFRVEAEVPNPDLLLKAGVTATANLKLDEVEATRVPASILTLAEDGRTGIRYVDANNTVRFADVQTVDEDGNGLWVTGLPASTRVIVQGQDFVVDGAEVDARLEDGAASNRTSPIAATATREP